ncbi:uncharacterized protein LOC108670477 [Hyalella azteca]|uniref:Uncharacterized protein LOC108670477 n=1 Tax=Hyalella azteca TaxID=294128 RepID=A0A8B7NII0_HYAAZ|nr:uncharacterized protein LOC108670477 [Hyalella azteca]
MSFPQLLMTCSTLLACVTGRGPYWDLTSDVTSNYSSYQKWDAMQVAEWAPAHARVNGSRLMLLPDWCTCVEACRMQLSCLSVSVRAASDVSVNCSLSDVRGNLTTMIPASGYTHYQRSGVARLQDHCRTDDECASSDVFSVCRDGACTCRNGTVADVNGCAVNCSSGWFRVDLSDRSNCYFISTDRIFSSAAVDACQSRGGVLADIISQEEQDALASQSTQSAIL